MRLKKDLRAAIGIVLFAWLTIACIEHTAKAANNYNVLDTTAGASALPTVPGAGTVANYVSGFQSTSAVILTVPANRTFVGQGCVTGSEIVAPAGASAIDSFIVITTGGSTVTPSTGSVITVTAFTTPASATAGVGTVGHGELCSNVTVFAGTSAATLNCLASNAHIEYCKVEGFLQ